MGEELGGCGIFCKVLCWEMFEEIDVGVIWDEVFIQCKILLRKWINEERRL